MDSDLRKTGGRDGARETSLRECRSLCGTSFHNVPLRLRAEYADFRGLARIRLVRTCCRAARPQPLDPAALALQRTRTAAVPRHAEIIFLYLFVRFFSLADTNGRLRVRGRIDEQITSGKVRP